MSPERHAIRPLPQQDNWQWTATDEQGTVRQVQRLDRAGHVQVDDHLVSYGERACSCGGADCVGLEVVEAVLAYRAAVRERVEAGHARGGESRRDSARHRLDAWVACGQAVAAIIRERQQAA